MTGKCVKCGKEVKLGIDGSCKCCHKEICWECWVEAGHECPNCWDFDGKRDTANSAITSTRKEERHAKPEPH